MSDNPDASYPPNLSPNSLLSSSKTQEVYKWKETLHKHVSNTAAGRNSPGSKTRLHEMLRTVARSLGSLHKFPTASLQVEYTEHNKTAYKLMLHHINFDLFKCAICTRYNPRSTRSNRNMLYRYSEFVIS
jgi:hypothetical protein